MPGWTIEYIQGLEPDVYEELIAWLNRKDKDDPDEPVD